MKSQKALPGAVTGLRCLRCAETTWGGDWTRHRTPVSPFSTRLAEYGVTWNPRAPSRRTTEAELSSVAGRVAAPQGRQMVTGPTAGAERPPSGWGPWYTGKVAGPMS